MASPERRDTRPLLKFPVPYSRAICPGPTKNESPGGVSFQPIPLSMDES